MISRIHHDSEARETSEVVMKFSQMVYTRWGTQDSEVGLHLQQLMVYGTYNSTYWGL